MANLDKVKITHLGDDRFLIAPVPKPHLVARFVNTGNMRTGEALRAELSSKGVGADAIESSLQEARETGSSVVELPEG